MDNIFSNIKKRALYIAKYEGVNIEFFCESIGMSYGSFKGSAKQRPLNSNAIKKILNIYSNINAEWLVLGKGNMIKPIQEDDVEEPQIKNKSSIGNDFDFFYRLDAFMKAKGLNNNTIALEANISNGLISKSRKRRDISLDILSKILNTYPNLDANWLLTGNGYMLKQIENYNYPDNSYIVELQKDKIETLQQELLQLKNEYLKENSNAVISESPKKTKKE